MQIAYLDALAAVPPFPEALEAAGLAESEGWGDPEAPGPRGEAAQSVLEAARAALLDWIGGPAELVLASGGTEADNLALKGLCAAAPPGRRRLAVPEGDPLSLEHPARTLARAGWTLDRIPLDARGHLRTDALETLVDERTALVAMSLAHPTLGTWRDAAPAAGIARRAGARLHLSAWAAAASGLPPFATLGADSLSVSGRRLGGTSGAGALLLRKGTPIRPLLEGGLHEGGLRAGVPALGPVAAMGAAARRLKAEGPARAGRLRETGRRLARGLEAIPGALLLGDPERRIPGHAAACLEGLDAEALATLLAAEGVLLSSGSACATRAGKPDPGVLACGVPEDRARGTLCLWAWAPLSDAEADRAIRAVARAAERLRGMAPV